MGTGEFQACAFLVHNQFMMAKRTVERDVIHLCLRFRRQRGTGGNGETVATRWIGADAGVAAQVSGHRDILTALLTLKLDFHNGLPCCLC